MKIDARFKVRPVAGEYIVVDQGKNQANMTQIISLNSTALFLWNTLEGKDFSEKDVADLLAAQYGIAPEQAQTDAENFLNAMRKSGILHD